MQPTGDTITGQFTLSTKDKLGLYINCINKDGDTYQSLITNDGVVFLKQV